MGQGLLTEKKKPKDTLCVSQVILEALGPVGGQTSTDLRVRDCNAHALPCLQSPGSIDVPPEADSRG